MDGQATFVITLIIFLVGLFAGIAICAHAWNSKNMFCPECGRRYTDVVYCEYCGTDLKEIENKL